MKTDQVFVSHTSDMAQLPEGRSFVQAALDAVGRAGMAPVDMRYFAARESEPAEYCRQRVRGCEIYVAVIGFRYGTVVPGHAVSYTELEFGEAGAAGLPRLVFLLAATTDVPGGLADEDRRAVEGFRQRLRDAGLVVRDFDSAAGLELEVFHALIEVAGGAVPWSGQAARGVRYSLPPDTAAFTGRDEELGQITAAVADAAGACGVVMIHAIGGMPGVGKTALAVHAAHRLRHRFPDRQLFIDLHAHTPGQDPLAPAAALAGLLTATGVDARDLPGDLAARAGLWRDRMAGQRALLVLDNAADSGQVTPLLPGGGDCVVLVTSRRHLGDLPGAAVQWPLSTLSPGQAREMFLRLAPQAAAGSADALAELARLAGYLPLAISLLARVCARHPSWSLVDLAAETNASVLTLAAERDSVAAAFEVSYRHLAPGHQRFFRSLGLHLGTTVDAWSASALTGTGVEEAAGQLSALQGEGLLAEVGYRRYAMHDLISRFARDRAAAIPAASRLQALTRLLDYYQHTAALAETRLARRMRASPAPVASQVIVPDLPDSTRALAWARAERANLFACLDHVTETSQHARVVGITAGLATLLRHDGPWADAIICHTIAAQAGQHLGDRLGQASALIELGAVRQLTGDYPGAARALEEALSICRDLGDRLGHASALGNLGFMRRVTGDYPGATQALEEALSICRDLGDRLGQASALTELGAVRWLTGDYPGAAQAQDEALGTYRDLGDRRGQAKSLNHLGTLRRMTGDYPRAARAHEEALDIYRDLGDRHGQVTALNSLGAAQRMAEDYPGAAQALKEALSISRDLGDRLGQTIALNNLGVVRRLTGDYAGAAQAHEEALRTYREIGDRGGEAEVLNDLGALQRVCGDLGRARRLHRQALQLARQIGSSWDEAHALAGLARCVQAAGNHAEAEAGLRQALAIFQQSGAAEAADIAVELNFLTQAGSNHLANS